MTFPFKLAAAAAALATALPLGAFAQGRPDLVAQSLRDPARLHVPGELIVQFRAGTSEAAREAALRSIDARADDELLNARQRADGKGDLQLVKLPPGLAIAAAMRGLERRAEIDFAEPNWIYTHQATSNDSYYTNGSLYGMYGATTTPANAFGSGAAAAWAGGNTCSSSVVVGIIDEGVMHTHEDLAANIFETRSSATGLPGVDDDGNGYIDDVRGWDFAGNDNSTLDGATDDHGTHVAGTIGAAGGNGRGVAGLCWGAKLVNAKFLGRNGGTTANAIKAVD